MPRLATAPKLVDLTHRVQDPGFDWNDFFPGHRAAAPADGRDPGIPAPVARAATMLQQMQQDGSLCLDFHPDSGQYTNLFNSGKIGMLITGPWDLSAFPDVKYGVVQMPSFDPGGSHITIAGPDNWVIFDNGPDRVE